MEAFAAIFSVAAVGTLAAALYKSLLDSIGDARRQRDEANARTDVAIAAGDRNAAAVEKLTASLERRNRTERPA